MEEKFKKSLFVFRRDMRLVDNTGLIACARLSQVIVPLFIYDPRQITEQNAYRSDNAVQFMLESIEDLKGQLMHAHGKLYECTGQAEEVLEDIFKKNTIHAVFLNRDYTPFSRARDEHIQHVCQKYSIDFLLCDDYLLNSPDTLSTVSKKPLQVFGAFFKRAVQIPVLKPQVYTDFSFYTGTLKTRFAQQKVARLAHNGLVPRGGTVVATRILKHIKIFADYAQKRDTPEFSTTCLSAHNKFGTVSIRSVYHAIGKQLGYHHALIRQLYWRDFFTYLAYHFPRVFGHAFKSDFERIVWRVSTKDFDRWKTGTTGFPIVDAGIRELNATGFMHNRVRMIVASFLTKDLLIDWRLGEHYFATKLVDYDPAVNNGNWQWVASTGADAQPYFRIFNPWLQQKKFDPHGIYIKKWIPELRDVPSRQLHAWDKKWTSKISYPAPMVDHGVQRRLALSLLKNLSCDL